MTDTPTVIRHLVPDGQRMAVAGDLFGIHFPLRLESTAAATGSSTPWTTGAFT